MRSELEGRLTILKDAAKNLEDPGIFRVVFASLGVRAEVLWPLCEQLRLHGSVKHHLCSMLLSCKLMAPDAPLS